MLDKTMTFSVDESKDEFIKHTLNVVYDALKQKGYNPVNQIVGYILSQDPTYITTHNNARSLICKIDRDDLLKALVKAYLNINQSLELMLQNICELEELICLKKAL